MRRKPRSDATYDTSDDEQELLAPGRGLRAPRAARRGRRAGGGDRLLRGDGGVAGRLRGGPARLGQPAGPAGTGVRRRPADRDAAGAADRALPRGPLLHAPHGRRPPRPRRRRARRASPHSSSGARGRRGRGGTSAGAPGETAAHSPSGTASRSALDAGAGRPRSARRSLCVLAALTVAAVGPCSTSPTAWPRPPPDWPLIAVAALAVARYAAGAGAQDSGYRKTVRLLGGRAPALGEWRRIVDRSLADEGDMYFATTLRPQLQRLFAARLAERHGVELHRSPQRARGLVGAELWPWIDPEAAAARAGDPRGRAARAARPARSAVTPDRRGHPDRRAPAARVPRGRSRCAPTPGHPAPPPIRPPPPGGRRRPQRPTGTVRTRP